jgi:hypothetical protein
MQLEPPADSVADLVARLKHDDRATHGFKKDTLSYEIIAGAIGANEACCSRARSLLNAITDVAAGVANPLFAADAPHPDVWIFQP